MQIELIGCTGAGKSTLARDLLHACRARGVDAMLSDDFVLEQAGLRHVRGQLVRTLLVDLLALLECLLSWQKYRMCYLLMMRTVTTLPRDVGWFERLNIARNVLKKIGSYEIARRRATPDRVILVDEGTLHTAHYLFVHRTLEPSVHGVAALAALIPLPDIAIYVATNTSLLISRTLERGHKRIHTPTYDEVERFITRAVRVFEMLTRHPSVQSRLLVVNDSQVVIADPHHAEHARHAMVAWLLDVWKGSRLMAVGQHRWPDPLSVRGGS